MNDTRLCATCGVPLGPPKRGQVRKYCSGRCRKYQYGGTCRDCGGHTDGGNGRALAAVRCAACDRVHRAANRRWTDDAIIDAIRRWNDVHGRPPGATQWARATRGRDYPSLGIVQRSFGTWNAAIAAAGFAPLATGQHRGRHAAVTS